MRELLNKNNYLLKILIDISKFLCYNFIELSKKLVF